MIHIPSPAMNSFISASVSSLSEKIKTSMCLRRRLSLCFVSKSTTDKSDCKGLYPHPLTLAHYFCNEAFVLERNNWSCLPACPGGLLTEGEVLNSSIDVVCWCLSTLERSVDYK